MINLLRMLWKPDRIDALFIERLVGKYSDLLSELSTEEGFNQDIAITSDAAETLIKTTQSIFTYRGTHLHSLSWDLVHNPALRISQHRTSFHGQGQYLHFVIRVQALPINFQRYTPLHHLHPLLPYQYPMRYHHLHHQILHVLYQRHHYHYSP